MFCLNGPPDLDGDAGGPGVGMIAAIVVSTLRRALSWSRNRKLIRSFPKG